MPQARDGDFAAKWTSRSGKVEAGAENDAWPWDSFSGPRWQQPEHRDDRHLASILGPTFETLTAKISGHPAVVSKLTVFETRNSALHFFS